MSVARSGSGTQFVDTGGSYVTSVNLTTYTVSAGSNLALYAGIAWDQAISAVTLTWNGVAMTQVSEAVSGSNRVRLYRLVNPATGNKTLAASWTTISPAVLGAAAFSGVDQVTPEIVADTLTNSGTSTTPSSGAITSGSSDATLAVAASFDPSTANVAYTTPETQTSEWRDTVAGEVTGSMTSALGGSSNNHTFTTTTSKFWEVIGVHIAAASSTTPGQSIGAARIATKFVGPMALRNMFRQPTLLDQTVAPPTSPAVMQRPAGTPFVGPPALRRLLRPMTPYDVAVAIAAGFDPALMAAMSWPWPQIVISQPQVVASGMTPPDNVPN